MQFSSDGVTFTAPEPYSTSKSWALTTSDGLKTVYVRYTDVADNASSSVLDTITLDTTKPVVSNVSDSPDPFKPKKGQSTTIRFTLADNLSVTCAVRVSILNSSGVLVDSIASSASCPAAGAPGYVVWNGRNSAGEIVPKGIYLYQVLGSDVAGNEASAVSGTVGVKEQNGRD